MTEQGHATVIMLESHGHRTTASGLFFKMPTGDATGLVAIVTESETVTVGVIAEERTGTTVVAVDRVATQPLLQKQLSRIAAVDTTRRWHRTETASVTLCQFTTTETGSEYLLKRLQQLWMTEGTVENVPWQVV